MSISLERAKELIGGPKPENEQEALYKFFHALTLLFVITKPQNESLDGFSVPCEYEGGSYVVRVEKVNG